jgi:putative hydrolase of the HAD superfamily
MAIDMARVKAVVFDLGGVLIEIDPGRCFRYWSDHGGSSPEALRQKFVPDGPFERHERGEIDFAEYAGHLRGQLALNLDDDIMREGWNALLGDALPGAVDAIEQATRRYPCFLFSNSNPVHHATWGPAHQHLLAPLTRQFVSSELGFRKPEPRAYAAVAELTGFAPETLLFFDDLEENVEAAQQIGFQAVTVSGPREVLACISGPVRD